MSVESNARMHSAVISAASLFLAFISPPIAASAQSVPDIVWSTNAHGYAVTAVAYSRDSPILASASGDRTAKVLEASNGSVSRVLVVPGGARAVAISTDGAYVAAGDGGKTGVWRINDGMRMCFSGSDNDTVWSLGFSPDGSFLGIGGSWGLSVGRPIACIGIPFGEPAEQQVVGVAFSPSGQYLPQQMRTTMPVYGRSRRERWSATSWATRSR
jgi:WD40 repeat protein